GASRRTPRDSTPTDPTCNKRASLDVFLPELHELRIVIRANLPSAGEIVIVEQLRKASDLAQSQNLVCIHAQLLRHPLVRPVATLKLHNNFRHRVDPVLTPSAVVPN